jgi:hypothetical protein
MTIDEAAGLLEKGEAGAIEGGAECGDGMSFGLASVVAACLERRPAAAAAAAGPKSPSVRPDGDFDG